MLERVADWQRLSPGARQEALGRSIETARNSGATFIAVCDTTFSSAPAEGSLAGIPLAVKDNLDARGFATTAGTRALRDAHPDGESSVVTSFRQAGAVTIGKTNLHELAFGITSNNAGSGAVRHPLFPDLIAGGSSGGSAAAVALGIVPLALGTDTGGSISVPAALCGVAGWRPTTGRWPGDGVVHLSWTRDTVGVHAAAVTDLALADGLVTGETGPMTGQVADPLLRGVRLGVVVDRCSDLAPEVALAFEAATRALTHAGATLVDVEVDPGNRLTDACQYVIAGWEGPRSVASYLHTLDQRTNPVSFVELVDQIASLDVRRIFDSFAASPPGFDDYDAALATRARLRRRTASAFDDHDVAALLFPTVPVTAPPVGADEVISLNQRDVPTFATLTRHTAPGSVAGVPVAAVPLPVSGAGVGLSIEGRFFDDRRLLALAAKIADAVGSPAGSRSSR